MPLALQDLFRCCRSSKTANKVLESSEFSFSHPWAKGQADELGHGWAGGEHRLCRGNPERAQARQEPERHHYPSVRDKAVLGVSAWSVPVTGTEGGGGTAAIPEVTLGPWKGCAVPCPGAEQPSGCIWVCSVNAWLSQGLEH